MLRFKVETNINNERRHSWFGIGSNTDFDKAVKTGLSMLHSIGLHNSIHWSEKSDFEKKNGVAIDFTIAIEDILCDEVEDRIFYRGVAIVDAYGSILEYIEV